MSELARPQAEPQSLLPAERTLTRAGWYARSVPVAVVVGGLTGSAAVHLSPLVMWAALAAVLGWTVLRRRRVIAMLREHDDAVHLVAIGDIARARQIFAALVARARTMPALHALFSLGLAGAELDDGAIALGLARLESVRDSGWLSARGVLGGQRPVLHGRLALGHAQAGDGDAAQRELELAHALLPEARRGSLLLVDAVVMMRFGRSREARARIAEDLARARGLLPAAKLGCVRVFAAWAATQGELPELRGVAPDEDVRTLLADDDTRRTMLRLAHTWPALHDFLRAHGVELEATAVA